MRGYDDGADEKEMQGVREMVCVESGCGRWSLSVLCGEGVKGDL